MKLVIVDSDISASVDVKALLALEDIYIWNINTEELSENGYDLQNVLLDIEYDKIEQAALLSKFSSGVVKYHTAMLKKSAGIPFWTIVALDNEYQAVQKQMISVFEANLAAKEIRYRVIFDKSDALLKTNTTLAKSVPARRWVCLISKNDPETANRLAEYIVEAKPDWECVICSDTNECDLDTADRIVVIGNEISDFNFKPVQYGLDRLYFWFEIKIGEPITSKFTDKKQVLVDSLISSGWNMASQAKHMLSGISKFEKIKYDLDTKAAALESLVNDEDFVMWDKYGLPVSSDTYKDTTVVYKFLEEHCCIDKIFA